ncbi:MAG: hypothetical protein Kow0074_18580 [Candidatus Zixiibacteriota bacterium]
MLSWELKCPHCGGPNNVAADRYSLTCRYCGAGLWVKLPDSHTTLVARRRIDGREAVFAWDRHLKENGQALSRSRRESRCIYLPFWKISTTLAVPKLMRRKRMSPATTYDGTEYSAQMRSYETDEDSVEELDWEIKPWDMTIPAFNDNDWGLASLGIRAETMPLTGWDRVELGGFDTCWPRSVSESEALQRIGKTVNAMTRQGIGTVVGDCHLITPKLALVYWPLWVLGDRHDGGPRSVEIDAVSGRVIRDGAIDVEAIEVEQSVDAGVSPQLLPHRCVNCGQDLIADDRYVVFSCTNCQAMISHNSNGQRDVITVEFAATDDEPRKYTWYPFWSFGDSSLLIPAFAIRNFRQLVRFSEIMSGQERGFHPLERNQRLKGIIGATLPSDAATGFAKVVLERDQWQGILPRRRPASVDLSAGPKLVYAPLNRTGTELVDGVTGLCMPCSALD